MVRRICNTRHRHVLRVVQVLFLTAGLLVSSIGSAATYFVATNGNDSNPGTISQPFRTLGKGISVLTAGDTLYIRGGTYDALIGGWDIPAGFPNQHTIIAGYGNENPVIRPSSIPNHRAIFLFRRYITLQDFTIDAINGGGDTGCAYLTHHNWFVRMTCLNSARDGIHIIGENTVVRDSHIKDCGRILLNFEDTKGVGIHANSDGETNTSNLLLENNLIEGCRAGGIAVHQFIHPVATNVVIRNNVIRNFGSKSTWPQASGASPQYGTGITIGHGNHFYIYNNLIYAGGNASGDSVNQCFLAWGGGAPDRPHGSYYYIYNNTCHDVDVGLDVWNQANNVTARNNIFSQVREVARLRNGVNNSNSHYVTNPIFSSPGAGDFSLRSDSPGIDQGVNLSPIVTTDIAGINRPQNLAYDVGAYEYNGDGVTPVSRPTAPANLQVSPF